MSNGVTLVGIGYKARHGKDTVATAIYEKWKDVYDVRLYSFAEELKHELNSMDQFAACLQYGIEYDFSPDRSDPLCQTKHGKQSKLLQFWGQKSRQEDSYVWVKKLDARLKADRPAVALIKDLRYLNEYFYIKSNGGYTLKCNRLGFVDLSRDATHISEVDLDGKPFDYEITVTDGDLEELKKDALVVFDLIVNELNVHIPEQMELMS